MEFNQQLAKLRAQVDAFYRPAATPMAKALTPKDPNYEPQVIGREEFLAKALTSVGRGHITGAQLTEVEYCLNAGRRPPERLIRAVVDGVEYSPFA